MDPRLALILFALLLLAAATPIVVGWLALLPADREPFERPGASREKKPRDPFAIFLLANVSVSLLLRVPPFDATRIVARLAKVLPAESANHVVMIGFIWFGFVPGLAAAYSAVRANPLRISLLVGGVLTLLLWLVGPLLASSIAGQR
jgi:hypothetical protein